MIKKTKYFMKIYSKYENSQEFCWYDSTNVMFSKFYDNQGSSNVLKVIFKQGQTYLYKDVDANDYVMFRDADSNGSAFSKYIIKKYSPTRIQDTDMGKLDKMKEKFISENQELQEAKVSELTYVIEYSDETGEFVLRLKDKVIYSGVEGQVSIVNLFSSMGINCALMAVDKVENKTDEEEDKIITE